MPGGFSYLGNFKTNDTSAEIVSASVGPKALLTTCADAVTIEVSSSTGKLQLLDQGTSAANGVQRDKMSKYSGFWLQGSLTASSVGGAIFSVENTFGSILVGTRVLILVTTATSGACEIDVGFASDATTSAADLINDLNVNAATGVFDNIDDGGATGEARGLFTSGGAAGFINASMASGAISGLVGTYAIHVIDIN